MNRPAMRPGVECSMSLSVFQRWRLISALALTLAIVSASITTATTTAALAQGAAEAVAPTWAQTTLTEPGSRLFTPASGALFARTAAGLHRSDDAGQTWREISLPAAPEQRRTSIVVDPTNHATIYLAAADGIYKSDDDGASWRTLKEYTGGGGMSGGGPDVRLTGLALDPTSSERLLVSLTATLSGRPHASTLWLSLDGGATWADASPEGIGKLGDTAFGVDGRMLFAASETGVWRAAMP